MSKKTGSVISSVGQIISVATKTFQVPNVPVAVANKIIAILSLFSYCKEHKGIECLKKQCKTQTVRFVFVGRHQLRCWETVAKPPFIH